MNLDTHGSAAPTPTSAKKKKKTGRGELTPREASLMRGVVRGFAPEFAALRARLAALETQVAVQAKQITDGATLAFRGPWKSGDTYPAAPRSSTTATCGSRCVRPARRPAGAMAGNSRCAAGAKGNPGATATTAGPRRKRADLRSVPRGVDRHDDRAPARDVTRYLDAVGAPPDLRARMMAEADARSRQEWRAALVRQAEGALELDALQRQHAELLQQRDDCAALVAPGAPRRTTAVAIMNERPLLDADQPLTPAALEHAVEELTADPLEDFARTLDADPDFTPRQRVLLLALATAHAKLSARTVLSGGYLRWAEPEETNDADHVRGAGHARR